MSELNFIKYNVNGKTNVTEDLVIRLNNLGFNIISESKDYKSTMWACNQCILLVSRDDNMPTGINGFGFNSAITPDGSVHCDTTGMNKFINKNGHEIYTYPIEKFKDNEFFFDYLKKEIKEKRKMGHLTILNKKD